MGIVLFFVFFCDIFIVSFLASWLSGSGPLVLWFSGPVVLWSRGPLVLWSSGPVVQRLKAPAVICSARESHKQGDAVVCSS